MLRSLALLILCQAAGEVLHAATRVPVPGTVTGMGLLLALLCLWRRRTGGELSLPAADPLLSYLSLFFVPPGVVAVMSAGRFAHAAPAVIAGLLGSSVLTLIVAGRLVQALLVWSERRRRSSAAVVADGVVS
jgi:holin-like protein